MANTEGTWLSIIEYSSYKKVSISTIRRHIKANLVRWKEVDGKYLIWTAAKAAEVAQRHEADHLKLLLENQRLKTVNRQLQEELAEARMLITLYEEGQGLSGEATL